MSKGKSDIKRDILSKFREVNAGPGRALPPSWLEIFYISGLNPKEKRLCEQAVNELVDDGLVLFKDDSRRVMIITERGVEKIFSNGDYWYADL
jgi:predicted transcriptional regulator